MFQQILFFNSHNNTFQVEYMLMDTYILKNSRKKHFSMSPDNKMFPVTDMNQKTQIIELTLVTLRIF